jgi:Glycosyl hydrolase family 30 beta sandwich domain
MKMFILSLPFPMPTLRTFLFGAVVALAPVAAAHADYPVHRGKPTPVPPDSNFTVHADQPQQTIKGLGFEIQSDSINSGNKGMPDEISGVPHDLTPEERTRFSQQMLKGFRYCRLAGGLYWRGLDADQKQFVPRWPEQASELKDMIHDAGIEGVLFEYWSPAPFWKINRKLPGPGWDNKLRCFTDKLFKDDPDYHGDVDAFLKDFTAACVKDLATLRDAGIPVSMWGLQNEPFANTGYSSCIYSPEGYSRVFAAVAPAIRAFDPKIIITADDASGQYIKPALANPETAKLVDAFTVHQVGIDSAAVKAKDLGRPTFEDEYEYLSGPASPDRCVNTVQYAMNWFQRRKAPTWFWIHVLKPVGNSESSGYGLGYWRPPNYTGTTSPALADVQPGHWTWNKYNWNSVACFLRRMPWDSKGVAVDEETPSENLRIFSFLRPDGKLVIVLSNRSGAPHTFHVAVGGIAGATFQGWRYTPEDDQPDGLGKKIDATQQGPVIAPQLADNTWEFWEQN